EPADPRGQHVGNGEAGGERQQDALQQPERDDGDQDQAGPEQQSIGALAHNTSGRELSGRAVSGRTKTCAHRARYQKPETSVVIATAAVSSGITMPLWTPSPRSPSTKPTSAIWNSVLILLMNSGSKWRDAPVAWI